MSDQQRFVSGYIIHKLAHRLLYIDSINHRNNNVTKHGQVITTCFGSAKQLPPHYHNHSTFYITIVHDCTSVVLELILSFPPDPTADES